MDWLRLARTPEVGLATFAQLIARFGMATSALENLPRLASRGGGKNFTPAPQADISREWERLDKVGGRLILSCDEDFPQGLAALAPPPPLISVLGTLPKNEMIAIVGARNASALGRKFAHLLARDLGEAGLSVVSGLARGIDSAAHEASLDYGTVAVVAGGVDVIYPPENETLYRAIVEKGVVISEMPFGEVPQARHFPRRNRLISGLARGVVVVEAAERSGSLISLRPGTGARGFRRARLATGSARQGRQPVDPRRRSLIECANDVLSVLEPILGRRFREPETHQAAPLQAEADLEKHADDVRRRVEEALSASPVAMDELIRQDGAAPSAVAMVILELELAGRCRRHPGNRVSWAGLGST